MVRFTVIVFIATALFGCTSMKSYRSCRGQYIALQSSYAQLESQNKELIQSNTLQSEVIAQFSRERERAARLETLLAERQSQMDEIRDLLGEAIGSLRGHGIEIENRNGVVYVSMDDKLLFESGKAQVSERGQEAIWQIGSVLAKNTHFNITIEGHTDNKGYISKPGDQIVDNWDLSTKRATEVVRIMLTNRGLSAKRVIASGRSHYLPVASNESEVGRAHNRRTEIMLTPQLDKVIDLLNNYKQEQYERDYNEE